MAENPDLREPAEETANIQSDSPPQENTSSDGEFKVTIRKLEMPVRPRGVLAE
jgi:hypothetical protein